MYRKTEDPQTVDSPRADSEWKADPAIGELSHGRDGPASEVDRSHKAAAPPDVDFSKEGIVSGGGEDIRQTEGWTGSGKGPLDPEAPKRKEGL